MRTTLLLASALGAAAAAGGCNWTEFDDLADTTWVRSTNEPNVGSRNYALAIVGVTTSTSGGLVGVISDDTPDYSTIEYGADGTDKIGMNDLKLGQQRVAALTDPPLLTTDGNGNIALAERSATAGNIAVVFGSATAPAGLEFPATASPDAVAFGAGSDIVIAAGSTLYTLQAGVQVPCVVDDPTFTGAAAIASDGTRLWIWSKTGAFFSYPLASLAPCAGGMVPAPGASVTTSLMPAVGAHIHLVGSHAILTAHAPTSRMGQVFVIDVSNVATPTQTDMLNAEGLRSSTVAVLDGTTYLALGVPDRAVDGVVSGEVDVHGFDTATGKLTPAPAMSLHDAQPDAGELFGRSVTTMKFNDKQILVIAANSEVFAYYKTALYDALP